MKFLLKIFTIFSSLFFLSGCFAKYETPPIAKKVDLQKAGVIAEFDMSVTEQDIYTFFLNYVYDGEQWDKELAELEKQYPNTHRSDLPDTNTQKIIDKIIGMDAENHIEKKGSKIVLKVTVTPLFDFKEDYKYAMPEYWSIGPSGGKQLDSIIKIKSDKPFETTIDLSEYRYSSDPGSRDGLDRKKENGYGKTIVSMVLPKGDYHIKLESLEDVPEINQIKTTFSIRTDKHKV